jgi:hypothetical protein
MSLSHFAVLGVIVVASCAAVASRFHSDQESIYTFTYYESNTVSDVPAHAQDTLGLPAPPPAFSASYYAGEIAFVDTDGVIREDLISYEFRIDLKIASKDPDPFRTFHPSSFDITYQYDTVRQASDISIFDSASGEAVAFPLSVSMLHTVFRAISHDELQHPEIDSFDLPGDSTLHVRRPRREGNRSSGGPADLLRWTVGKGGELKSLVSSQEFGTGERTVFREIHLRSTQEAAVRHE